MSLLFRIVRAAHANGTHHKLALDAVSLLAVGGRERWQDMFLKNAELFIKGSKAPDDEFKDFKNHVLHPRDNYWGGAPEKVEAWYSHLVTALREEKWSEAAWCAGVLSHYYTDPIHPFHTAQSEAENSIHRAAEWSINRSYDVLLSEGRAAHPIMAIDMPDGDTWLRDLVCRGAERSNKLYEKLIAHYDLNAGVVDPPSGLDPFARKLVGELIVYASQSFAAVLDRAIVDSGAKAPDVSLTLETIVAALKIPLKMVQKKLSDAEDRRIVEAMYDELKATGRVDATLPEDDRVVRDLYAKEVLAPREAKLAQARAERVAKPKSQKSAVPQQRAGTRAAVLPPALAQGAAIPGHVLAKPKPQPAPATVPVTAVPATAAPFAPQGQKAAPLTSKVDALAAAPLKPAAAPAPAPAAGVSPAPVAAPLAAKPEAPKATPAPAPIARAASAVPITAPPLASLRRPQRLFLAATDNVEAAPSIGPKMAERLAMAGVTTVADLMGADTEAVASKLGDKRITGEIIRDWQDQARLVMTVPGLRGWHARLLVGAGWRSVDDLAAADPAELSAKVLTFAAGAEGQRILREGQPPDLEAIHSWITAAVSAKAA